MERLTSGMLGREVATLKPRGDTFWVSEGWDQRGGGEVPLRAGMTGEGGRCGAEPGVHGGEDWGGSPRVTSRKGRG